MKNTRNAAMVVTNNGVTLPGGTVLRVIDGNTVSVGNTVIPADEVIHTLVSARVSREVQVFWFVWGRMTSLAVLAAIATVAHGAGTTTGFLVAAGAGATIVMEVPRTIRKFREAALAGRVAERIQQVLAHVSGMVWKARMEGRGW